MARAVKRQEPKIELLSISEIARRCGINRATASARLDDLGYEPHETSTPKNQLFEFDDEMLFSIKAAKDSLSAAKIRDTRAAAQIKELKLAEARGELVPMAEVVELVQTIVGKIYQELTGAQGKRIDSKLAKARTVIEVKKIRNGDNQRILKMLRANFEEFVK